MDNNFNNQNQYNQQGYPQQGYPQGQFQQGYPQGQYQQEQIPQMSLSTPPQFNSSSQPPQKNGNGMKIAIIIISILLVAAIVAIVAILLNKDKDDKDSKKDDDKQTEETTDEEETEEETEEDTEEETTEEKTTEEVTTEEETTEETTQAPTTTVDTSGIPFTTTDWTSLEFAVDGVVYSWPMSYADIKSKGFSVDAATEAETLEASYYSFSVSADYTNGDSVYLQFKNFTDTDKTVVDCDILGISFDQYYFSGSVVLCNGVTFGMTYDEVKALMGEPSYEYISEDSDYVSVDYEVSDDVYTNTISFTFSDGTLSEIDIENWE